LTLRKKSKYLREFELLHYSFSGASVFFKFSEPKEEETAVQEEENTVTAAVAGGEAEAEQPLHDEQSPLDAGAYAEQQDNTAVGMPPPPPPPPPAW
jgi:hypothetical protein